MEPERQERTGEKKTGESFLLKILFEKSFIRVLIAILIVFNIPYLYLFFSQRKAPVFQISWFIFLLLTFGLMLFALFDLDRLDVPSKKNKKYVLYVLILSIFGIALLSIITGHRITPGKVNQIITRSHIHGIHNMYDTHRTAISNDWCDELTKYENYSRQILLIPDDDKNGQEDIQKLCSFAVNENVINHKLVDLPEDVLVFFLSEPGWNQVGGREDVRIMDWDQRGTVVCYANGAAEFIEEEDISNLRWEMQKK